MVTFAPPALRLSQPAPWQAASPRLWAERHVQTERGVPMRYEGRPWMRQMLDDPHPRQRWKKCAQVYATTGIAARVLHACAVKGQTFIYTFPTDGDASAFVTGRLDPMIENSPVLNHLTGRANRRPNTKSPTDNQGMKRIGPGLLYIRGSQTRHGAVAVPADGLVHDELDLSVPGILGLFKHRLDAVDPPDLKQIYELSNPTVPGYGIDKLYNDSDAREWLVRCTGCAWWGALDYWRHTEGYGTVLRCYQCGTPLDPRNGEWVAAHPDRSADTHGYHVSRLMTCLPERPDLLLEIHRQRLEAEFAYEFTNMVLGLASSEGSLQLDKAAIRRACQNEDYAEVPAAALGTGPYYMGVDQGDVLWAVIVRRDPVLDGDVPHVVGIYRLEDPTRGSGGWKEIYRLMTAFAITLCVVDGQPNSAPAHDLARAFPDRVLCCYYSEGQKAEIQESADVKRRALEAAKRGYRLEEELDATEDVDITVNRTETLDRLAASLIAGRWKLPGPPHNPKVDEYLTHVNANVRRPQPGPHGGIVYRWFNDGPDHLFHASNYAAIAMVEAERLARLAPTYQPPFTVDIVSQQPLRGGEEENQWWTP